MSTLLSSQPVRSSLVVVPSRCMPPALSTSTMPGGGASAETLIQNLAALRPTLVVTTSYGMTGPLHDVDQMRSQLGLLVDGDRGPCSS